MASFALTKLFSFQAAIENAIHRHGMNEEGRSRCWRLIEHFEAVETIGRGALKTMNL